MLARHSRWMGWLLLAGVFEIGCGGSASSPTAASPTPNTSPAASPLPSPAVLPGAAIDQTEPADLTIRFVQRLPRIDYVFGSARPDVEGWPTAGQAVSWRAHLKNWATFPLTDVDFTWRLDGRVVRSGTLDIRPLAEATLDYAWSWDRRRDELELVVDASNRFSVPRGPFNHLLLYTDALSVGFYVEERVYRLFRENQHQLRIGSSCFEDWAQLQIRFYNDLLAKGVYPETPSGVLDRLRLDNLTVVADGALPLSRVNVPDDVDQRIFATYRPNGADRTVDLQFGFPAEAVEVYTNHASRSTENQFYFSGFVQHEMGHARYLVDTHRMNVGHGLQGQRIDIMEGGALVAGSRYMPGTLLSGSGGSGLRVHRANYRGLMDNEWTLMDRWAAGAWNLIARHRATRGNYNSPDNYGAYLQDLPLENRLTLRDATGGLLPGANVRVFQAGSSGRIFDNTPDLERVADDRGQVLLGSNPFSADGRFSLDLGNGIVILRVQHSARVGYGFLELADFNLAYWRGQTELADHELPVTLH